MSRGYYTTTEAVEKLGVSIYTIKRMLKDGRLNGAEVKGGRYLIPAEEVEKYLVPVEQAAEVEAAAMARWSDHRKANFGHLTK